MVDAASDLKRSNYSRGDESARRLWLTQRTQVNPWEHRAPDAEDQQPGRRPGEAPKNAPGAPEALITLIPQTDRLQLAVHESQAFENPFAELIIARQVRDPVTGR